MTALAATAETTNAEIETTGTAAALSLGPLGLLAAAVVGLETAFGNTGKAASDFVTKLNQGFNTSTQSGISAAIDEDNQKIQALQKTLDSQRNAVPSFLIPQNSAIGQDIGKLTGADKSQAQIDGLKKSVKDFETELSNAKQVAADTGQSVSDVFAKAAQNSIPLTGNVKDLDAKFAALTQTVNADGTSIQGLGSSFVDAAGNVETLSEATVSADTTLVNAVTGLADAQDSLKSAQQQVTNSQQAEAKAYQDYISLLPGGTQYTKDLAAAKQTLATASNDVRSAQEAETKAEDDLTKARQGATALDLADAQSKITLAADTTDKDKASIETAQEKLDALEGSGTASQATIAAAQADVKDAQDQVTQSIIDQGKAAQDLITLKQKGTQQDPAVVSAEQAVADAHDRVTQAQQKQQTAADALAVAQVGDADKIAAALQTYNNAQAATASAAAAVGKAQFAVQQKTDDLNTAYANQSVNLAAVNKQLGPYIQYMQILNGLAAAQLQTAQQYSATLGVSGGSAAAPDEQPGGANFHANIPPGRASGGPVEADTVYLVGEKGPELLKMGSQGGTVIPNEVTAATLSKVASTPTSLAAQTAVPALTATAALAPATAVPVSPPAPVPLAQTATGETPAALPVPAASTGATVDTAASTVRRFTTAAARPAAQVSPATLASATSATPAAAAALARTRTAPRTSAPPRTASTPLAPRAPSPAAGISAPRPTAAVAGASTPTVPALRSTPVPLASPRPAAQTTAPLPAPRTATTTAPAATTPLSAPRTAAAAAAAPLVPARPSAPLGAPAPVPTSPQAPGTPAGGSYLSGQLPAKQPAAVGASTRQQGGTTVTQHVTTGPITTGASASDIAREIAWSLRTLPAPPPSRNN